MSRRSSILKPAKSRQPLQNVELNPTSAENSPATSTFKMKRRVSFAEKKHVKEFCDSMEQGTVWDNTYEESELSHKNSHSSNSDENTVTAEFSDESSKNLFPTNVASGKVGVSVHHESVVIGRTSKDLSSVYTESKSIFDLHWTGPQYDAVMDDSVFNALPMSIPHPAYHIESIKTHRSLPSVNDGFAGQSAMDENTQFRTRSDSCPAMLDSRTLHVTHVDSSNSELKKIAREDFNHDIPMEETIIGDVSTKSRSLAEIASVSTRSSIIAFVSERPIPDAVQISSAEPIIDNEKLDEENLEITKNSVGQEKFTIFHDTSMETTEAVSNLVKLQQPAKSFTTESREESSLVTSGRTSKEARSSNTEFINECSISDTAIISSAEPIVDNVKFEFEESPGIVNNSVPQEKFTIFHDTSMEVTEAVSNFVKPRQPTKSLIFESGEESSSVTARRTTIGTEALQFKEPVSILEKRSIVGFVNECPIPDAAVISSTEPIVDDAKIEEKIPQIAKDSVGQEKFTIFHDSSMEITEAVPNFGTARQPAKSVNLGLREELVTAGCSTMLGPEAMNFTEPKSKIDSHSEFNELNPKEPDLQTGRSICQDKSMNFTELAQTTSAIGQAQFPTTEKTTIFHDKSVDFTEIVENVPLIEKPGKSTTERTTLFHDKSLEFTDVVQNIPIVKHQQRPTMEKTTIFHDKSVDFTEIVENVPLIEKSGKSTTERTTLFHDKSLEFTDVVQNVPIVKHREIITMEKSTIFYDKSVDFTKIVENVSCIEKSGKLPTERTTLFHDKSMEFTNTVQNISIVKQRPKSPTERTTIFHDEVVDFTEVVRNIPYTDETVEKSCTDYSRPAGTTVDEIEKSRLEESLKKPETEEKNILRNRQSEPLNVLQIISSASKLSSHQSVDAIEKPRLEESLKKVETEEKNIFKNRQSELPNVLQKISSASKLSSQQSVDAIEKPRLEKFLTKPEPEEKNIFENRQFELPNVLQKISSSSKFSSQQSIDAIEKPRLEESLKKLEAEEKSVIKYHQSELPNFLQISNASKLSSQQSVDAIEKPRLEDSLNKPETEEKTISKNRQSELSNVLQIISSASKLNSQQSVNAIEKPRLEESLKKPESEEKSIIKNHQSELPNFLQISNASKLSSQQSVDAIEKPRLEDSLNKPETEEKTILKNRQSELSNVLQIISSASKSNSQQSIHATEKPHLEQSPSEPEPKEKNIVKNRHSELPKHLQIMSSASKLHLQPSLDMLKERMASVVKSLPEIQKPLPVSVEVEVRSPLRKRMKSLPNDSIAFTAALPFVMLQRKKTSDDEPPMAPEVTDEQSSKKTTIFQDQSMEVTESAAESSSFDQNPARIICSSPREETPIFQDELDKPETTFAPIDSADRNRDDDSCRVHDTTTFNDESMEITTAVPGIMRAEIIEAQENPKTTIFHDQSMEMTVAVSCFGLSRAVPTSSETRSRGTPDNGEAKSMIFRDDCMELTGAVKCQLPSSNAKERIYAGEDEVAKSHSSDPNKFDNSGKTMVFRNDCMELTGAVQYQLPSLSAKDRIYAGEDEVAKNHSSDPQKIENDGKTTVFRDYCMDLTGAVQYQLPSSSAKDRIYAGEDEVAKSHSSDPQKIDNTGKTMVFRDDCMELTGAVKCQLPSLNKDRIYAGEDEVAKSHWNDPKKFDNTGKTMVFRDDCMELTGAVQYQLPSLNKDRIYAGEDEVAKSHWNDPKKCDNSGKTMVFRDDCMELTGAVQYQLPSSNKDRIYAGEDEVAKSHWNDPKKCDNSGKTMVFRDDCMELTSAVQYTSNAKERICTNENEPPKSHWNDPTKNDNDAKTMVFRDDCMELTSAVQYTSNAKERICVNENEAPKSHWNDPLKNDNDGKTMVFRDDCMELTSAVQYTSNAKERICTNENETAKSHWNDPDKFVNDRKTMVFHDDCVKAAIADKENCPVGKEDFRKRAVRLFEGESRIAESKSEWLEKRKPSRPLSSLINDENLQRQAENFGSDDITGVVAFPTQIDEEEHEVDYRTSGNDSRASILGNEELEMTGVVPWKSEPEYANPPTRSSDSSRSFRSPAAADDLPTVDKNPQRSSQVAKELFQKSIANEAYVEENVEPVIVNERAGTADLEAEIRKLAESFDVEDESGFDQATFLRQQARCMEDYEANSTASQDCDPAALSVRTDTLAMKISDKLSNFEKSPDWKISPNLKMDNITGKSQCFSSKSLEELRYRAYSVGKFEHEPTGYELTAAIAVPENENFHKTVMLEDLQAVEPPSFLGDLAESVQSSRSVSELPTESEIGGKMTDGETRLKVDEPILRSCEDMPNATFLELPEITQTVNVERIVNEIKNDHAGERMERKDIRRSETYVMKKSIYDAPISISSPLEIDDDERSKNYRPSNTGLTPIDLRDRAYSVGKFEPEAMRCELNAASSIPNSENFHETRMLEDLQAVEPPSFLGDLAESLQSTRSISELPTESEAGGKITDGEKRREAHEAISRILEDVPNTSLSELTLRDITQTAKYMDSIANETKNEDNRERSEIRRSQANTMKKRVYDETIPITSSPEVDEERPMNRRRSSTGLTTAAEFSSASPNGPSEKLRRVDNALPTDGKEEKSTKLTHIGCPWDCKNFASSTVIVDDLTRQSSHPCAHESSAAVQNFSPDELPSAISTCEEDNVARSVCVEEVAMEPEVSTAKSPFDNFKEIIHNLAERFETIWEINLFTDKILALNFFSNSIVLAIYFNQTADAAPIKAIGFLSQLIEDGTDPGVCLAHSLIMKKVDSATLTRSYRAYEDVPEMLDFVTTEVKLGMDFMFELERLRNVNVMEIHGNRIDFIVRTRDINAGIILKLTMEIKPFAEINSNDIMVSPILGSDKIRENDIKRLITNVERDHRFLRYYMNDVKDYVDLMAETGFSASSGTRCN